MPQSKSLPIEQLYFTSLGIINIIELFCCSTVYKLRWMPATTYLLTYLSIVIHHFAIIFKNIAD